MEYERKDRKFVEFGKLYSGDVFFTKEGRLWMKTDAVFITPPGCSWNSPFGPGEMNAVSLDKDAGAICWSTDDELVELVKAKVVISE